MTKMDPEMKVLPHPALQHRQPDHEPVDVLDVLKAEGWWDEDVHGALPYKTAQLVHEKAEALGPVLFRATLRWLRTSKHPHAQKAKTKDFHWVAHDLQESNRHRIEEGGTAADGDTLAAVAELIRASRVTP